MDENGVKMAIAGASIALLIVSVGLILFVSFFFKARRKALEEKQDLDLMYVRTIAETENEIREETLTSMGRELHDNIGQLLTVSKLHISNALEVSEDKDLLAANSSILLAIDEVRSLAHSLESEWIQDLGLVAIIEQNVARLQKIEGVEVSFSLTGTAWPLASDTEVIAFRIVQEFLSNSLKHAEADQIAIELDYGTEDLTVLVRDNGKGFETNESSESKGNGLKNMSKRASIIHADFELDSVLDKGTRLKLIIPKNHPNV